MQAAIVNLDEPVKINKQTVPLGRQLAGGLVNGGTADDKKSDDTSTTNFAWVLTDADDASNGLGSGRYAAVVTIPKDFSANATSYSDQSGDTAEQAVIDVQTSAVSGVSDPVVGQAITAAATRALNSQLTEQYVKSIYVGFNDTGKQFTKVADAAGQLDDGTRKLADGLSQTSDGTTKLSDGLNQLDDGGGQLASGAKQLAGLGQYADGVGTLADKAAGCPGRAADRGRRGRHRDRAEDVPEGAARAGRRSRPGNAADPAERGVAGPGDRRGHPDRSLPTCAEIDETLTEAQCAQVEGVLGRRSRRPGSGPDDGADRGGRPVRRYAKDLATSPARRGRRRRSTGRPPA